MKIKEQPIATKATLTYGRGEALLKTNGEVAAIQIDYIGTFKGTNKLGKNWFMKVGRRKLIIFSLGKTPIRELLFNYSGELRILGCRYVAWDEKLRTANIIDLNKNTWNQNTGTFDFDARKPEEIQNIEVIGKKVRKSSI